MNTHSFWLNLFMVKQCWQGKEQPETEQTARGQGPNPLVPSLRMGPGLESENGADS